jgi:quinolinate synthase
MEHRVTVPEEVAARARLAIERMVSIGGKGGSPVAPLSPDPASGIDPGE